MKLLKHITNGIALIFIGIMHTQLVLSSGGFGKQFQHFSEKWFFKISNGMDELPATVGVTNFENFATFWFFYFGVMLIPLGILVHCLERKKIFLPLVFTISYLVVVLIGCYMIPNSGMTYFMLPHAVFMMIYHSIRRRKLTSDWKKMNKMQKTSMNYGKVKN